MDVVAVNIGAVLVAAAVFAVVLICLICLCCLCHVRSHHYVLF